MALPILVMRPRRCYSPLESSPGTKPRKAINARAEPKRRKSCNSARISIAVSGSMPRKQRSHPTGSRYGACSASSARRASTSRWTGFRVIDRQLIVVDHRALGGVCPRQTVDPAAMRLGPMPARVVQAASPQQFAEAMAAPLLACVVARPGQIAHSLVGGRGRLHDGQESCAPELGQFARIPTIRLDVDRKSVV